MMDSVLGHVDYGGQHRPLNGIAQQRLIYTDGATMVCVDEKR